MSQSVEKMRFAGWRATYIGRDCNEDNGILNGHYEYAFASAESARFTTHKYIVSTT